MIKELQTNADSLDGIGFAHEQAKIQAVLVLWSRLATAGKACQLSFIMNRQYIIQLQGKKFNIRWIIRTNSVVAKLRCPSLTK
ncbi:hypothetical protein [Salmonella enterica]|uniref:hypothetical protein n=1 Tax=Salmonella enterica TaxID=28901 RepID=UPI0009ABF1DF|nr:hypothetical protein [Salmonella enterica]